MPAEATPGSISARRGHGRAAGTAPVRAPDLAELETLVARMSDGAVLYDLPAPRIAVGELNPLRLLA